MNRLQFRVWDEEERKYYYTNGSTGVCFAINGSYFEEFIEQYPEHVDQIVLDDENGQKAFERDIIEVYDYFKSEPYCHGRYVLTYDPSNAGYIGIDKNGNSLGFRNPGIKIKVIGNVREHPELL